MKVLLSGGGTGGHVYPAIAIANKIKEENPDCEILFVGTEKGIESEIVPKYGYELKTVTVQGFRRKIDLENVKRVFKLCKGLEQSRRIVKKFKPDIVIGTGGYVSGPVLFNSALNKNVTIVHEQDSFPGVTNKILSKVVTRDGKVYAYPFSAGNGYFLYYNKKYFSGDDIKSLDTMLKKAVDNGKKITMNLTSGWYLYSFFRGAGLELSCAEDSSGNICNWNATDTKIKGNDVTESLLSLAASAGFVSLAVIVYPKLLLNLFVTPLTVRVIFIKLTLSSDHT